MPNPHYEREKKAARNFQARDSLTRQVVEPLDIDCAYDGAEYRTPITCGSCGNDAYKKASINAYVCDCGAIRMANGEWRKR